MFEQKEQRIQYLDVCKGFGIILVVLGHIALGYKDAILFLEYRDILVSIADCIYMFHMPFFMILSGWIFYKAYCVNAEDKKNNFILQIINLAWVFGLFSFWEWIAKCIFSGEVNSQHTLKDLLFFWIQPLGAYWYLWTLLLYYIIFYFILNKCGQRTRELLLITFGLSLVGSFLPGSANLTPKNLLVFIFPFCFGICLEKLDLMVKIDKLAVMILVIIVSTILFAFTIKIHISFNQMPILRIFSGMCVSISAILLIKNTFINKSRLLAFCGKHSLEIYVLHCFITAPNRKILFLLGIREFYSNIFVNCLLAALLPILIGFLLRKLGIYNFVFKPAQYIVKRKEL